MHWPLKGKVQNLVRGGPGGVGVPPKWTVSVTGVFEPFPNHAGWHPLTPIWTAPKLLKQGDWARGSSLQWNLWVPGKPVNCTAGQRGICIIFYACMHSCVVRCVRGMCECDTVACMCMQVLCVCVCIIPPWFRRQIWVMSWTPANPPLRAPASTRQRTRPWCCSTSAGRWWSSWKAQQGPACQGGFKWEIL